MRSNYDDILKLIPSKPIWWDVDGVPRYREPKKDEATAMRRIRCQACHRVFLVCIIDCYHNYMGNPMERTIPDEWHYGDPPFHSDDGNGNDCGAGYCMNSEPEYDWDKPMADWNSEVEFSTGKPPKESSE